jgi:hypothetical protein
MSSKVRACKYQCGTIIAWDTEEGYFIEPDNNNAPHTRERCESLRPKEQNKSLADYKPTVSNQDVSFQILVELRKANSLLAKIAGVDA